MRQREKAPNKQKTKSTVPSRPVPYRTEPHLQTRHFSRTRENIWTRRHVLDLGLVGLLGGLVRGGAEGGSVFFSPVFFSSLSFFPFLFSKFISTGERGTMRAGDGDGLGRGRGGRRRGWELGVFAWRKPVKERTEDSLFFFFLFSLPIFREAKTGDSITSWGSFGASQSISPHGGACAQTRMPPLLP